MAPFCSGIDTAAPTLANQGKLEAARKTVHGFHRRLCETRVLDPACGSGKSGIGRAI
ncbi:MAG: hypothetical protein ACC631_09010 [Halocynthiibacter sp.]